MPEIHARRRERLRAAIRAAQADAALITSLVNVRYLSGLASSHAAMLVPADGDAVLATDNRYALTAQRSSPDLELVVERAIESALADLAARRGIRRLAFEDLEMTVARHGALADREAADLVPLGRAVEDLRVVKDPREIESLSRACQVTAAAFDQVVTTIRPGMTERDLAVAIEGAMISLGAEKPAFDTIVASGPNGAVPHHAPGDRPFEIGDLITVDCGARCEGYHADMTRTIALGAAADWQRDLYGLVAAAQRAGMDAAAPGAGLADVDGAARGVIAEAGLAEHFTHGLGHGVGLVIHEAPMLAPGAAGKLADRVPITIEPGVYLPGRGGVRIEDTLVVRSGAPRSRDVLTATMTSTPGELLVLR